MPHCPHLGGHCTRTGQHHDHHGQAVTRQLPGADGPVHIETRLEHWADARPAIALYLGDHAADLTPCTAVRAAAVLALTAVRLLRLAAQHRTSR